MRSCEQSILWYWPVPWQLRQPFYRLAFLSGVVQEHVYYSQNICLLLFHICQKKASLVWFFFWRIDRYRESCGGIHAGECRNCTNAGAEEFYVSHGGVHPHGCQTSGCIKCPTGMFPDGCGGSSPGKCEDCLNMPNVTPPSHYFSSRGGPDGLCDLAPCVPDCGVGQYKALCGGTNAGFCHACTTPDPGFFHDGSGGLEDACPRKACEPCEVGFFRSGCDMANSGACVPCTNGPGHGYYYKSSSRLPNQCDFVPCGDCPMGIYRANCGGASEGACVHCTKQTNTYFIGNGGLTDACPTRLCAADEEECEIGQYRQGCGSVDNPSSPGICAKCDDHKINYFWVSNGGVSSRGCKESFCQRCDAGYVRLGCAGTSQGVCAACEYESGYYFLADGGFGERNLTCPRSPCAECPAGYYKHACGADVDHTNPGVCLECPAGKYQSQAYQESCLEAPAGTFATQGARVPSECPEGHYQGSAGMSSCDSCLGGEIQRTGGRAVACTSCPVGQYNDGSQDSCQQCVGNVIKYGSLPAGCTPCPSDSFNDGSSDACQTCSGGYVAVNPETGAMTCIGCPAGYYAASNQCTLCPSDTTSYASSTSCFGCQAGHRPEGGVCTPEPCPTGSSGSNVPAGCTCNNREGWAGSVVPTTRAPYWQSPGCVPLQIRAHAGTSTEVHGIAQGISSSWYRYPCSGSTCETGTGSVTSSDPTCSALMAYAAEENLCSSNR